jgi:hypothetical protein
LTGYYTRESNVGGWCASAARCRRLLTADMFIVILCEKTVQVWGSPVMGAPHKSPLITVTSGSRAWRAYRAARCLPATIPLPLVPLWALALPSELPSRVPVFDSGHPSVEFVFAAAAGARFPLRFSQSSDHSGDAAACVVQEYKLDHNTVGCSCLRVCVREPTAAEQPLRQPLVPSSQPCRPAHSQPGVW